MNFGQIFSRPISEIFGGRRAPVMVQKNSRRRPAIGATICCAKFRMTVPVGFNADLWAWLSAQGWHELADNRQRYQYRALPSKAVATLVDAQPESRERLLNMAIKLALDDAPAASYKTVV